MQLDRSGTRELPGQRMLAPARPDQENTHRASLVRPAAAFAYDHRVDDAASSTGSTATLTRGDLRRVRDRALFADDAVYRYHPWDGAGSEVVGREAIIASWLGDRDDPGSWSAEYRPWLVAGDRAVAVGCPATSARIGRRSSASTTTSSSAASTPRGAAASSPSTSCAAASSASAAINRAPRRARVPHPSRRG